MFKIDQENVLRIKQLVERITEDVDTAMETLKHIILVVQQLSLTNEVSTLQLWFDRLRNYSQGLANLLQNYLNLASLSSNIETLLAPKGVQTILDDLKSVLEVKNPETSEVHRAWDILTRLKYNLEILERSKAELVSARSTNRKAEVLLETFQKARDKILGGTLEKVNRRFVELYTQLHGSDEENFNSIFETKEAGLNLVVNFYGRGQHPPHSLHSEGHQDSMGVCLFIALTEQLTRGALNMLLLDDVVISIDIDHRKEICRLLRELPNQQIIITTHDKTWAQQLRSAGVVTQRHLVEFRSWNIFTGPIVMNYETDMWREIQEFLQRNEIANAAAHLRRALEQFFGLVCDSFQAPVIYKLNSRHSLGDFLPPAMKCYRELLKKAKDAAKSWGDAKALEELNNLDKLRGSVYLDTQIEQWAINAQLHYNNWVSLSQSEFQDVVTAFHKLCEFFKCSSCGGLLYVSTREGQQESVRCECGKVNWNLNRKKA